MSAKIIPLPVVYVERCKDDCGNGAREALIEIALSLPNTDQAAEVWADWILLELGARGFIAVPMSQ